ncbi:MAG: hypothetical protein R2738_10670 [Bacteroides graminisolvens]
MIIDAAGGAKIRSFKYKDAEVISQSPMRETFGAPSRQVLKSGMELATGS